MIKRFLERRGFVHKSKIEDLGYVKADKLPGWLLQTAEAERWTLPDTQVYENQFELYRKLSYLGTVIDIVSQTCTDAELSVEDTAGMDIEKHDFLKLLDKPNPFDSRTEFLRAHFSFRIGNGNSYWWLNRASENEPPLEMFILPPSKVSPVPDQNMGLRGYVYYPGNGLTIPLDTWEIAHFKSFNPFSRFLGLSAIESLAITASGAIAAQSWNTQLFGSNNARLEGIIAFADMIDDNTWGLLKRQVKDATAKREQMMLRGVGAGGVDWKQTGASHKDMEFIQGLDMSMREIYDRLAPGLYNMLTSNSSLANGKTGETTYWSMTISPLLRETSDKINLAIMPGYQDDAKVDFDEVVPEDDALEIQKVEQYSQFHTIDEVRKEKFGDDPDPDPERGKLFASQLKAAAPKPENPNPTGNGQMNMNNPLDTQTGDPQKPPEPPPAPTKAMLDEAAKWQAKVIKYMGKPVEWDAKEIPLPIANAIRSALKACKTSDQVRVVFTDHLKFSNGQKSEVLILADAINKYAERA